MGYHLITSLKESIKSIYIANLEALAYVNELEGDSIIIQGEKEWTPVRVKDNPLYSNYTVDWYRAGMKAQDMFREQAVRKGYIIEELSQDQASFKAYADNSKVPIKRGDFLIRNVRNLEIEVKCRTFYGEGDERYFLFTRDHLRKHLNMETFTHSPLVLAVYERDGDVPVQSSLCMISVRKIKELEKSLKKSKQKYGLAYHIPVNETRKNFQLISKFQED